MKKIKQLFRRGIALAVAAVTALSVLPTATASAASQRATITFEYCYDSSGNTIRYQQTFSHNGITCGHAGEARTRIYADGENAYCIEPGISLHTGNTLESTLTAFYTPPVVISGIYQALKNMGLKSGNILEPSCGTGNFIGRKPESLEDCKVYGVEIDSLSARIAQQLYQKSTIAVQGFETADLPDSFFDVVVGNVPFGNYKVLDKKYDKHNFLIHDYFIAKSIDKTRPKGILALITSNGASGGTMDKRDDRVRRYIAQRCDLIGAIRLPNNTFLQNAGTEVNTDILFLQKRETPRDLSVDVPYWVETERIYEQEYVDGQGGEPEADCQQQSLFSAQPGDDTGRAGNRIRAVWPAACL